MLSSKKNNGFSNNKQEVVSITYEEIGLFPRSFSRVLDRFLKQVFSDVEHLVIQEYRFYRYLFLTTVRSLLILFFVPFLINFLAKTYVIRPLTEYFWNTKQTEIFLNHHQEAKAFAELKDFEEKLYFESLIYPKERSASFASVPVLNKRSSPEAIKAPTEHSSTFKGEEISFQQSQHAVPALHGNMKVGSETSFVLGFTDVKPVVSTQKILVEYPSVFDSGFLLGTPGNPSDVASLLHATEGDPKAIVGTQAFVRFSEDKRNVAPVYHLGEAKQPKVLQHRNTKDWLLRVSSQKEKTQITTDKKTLQFQDSLNEKEKLGHRFASPSAKRNSSLRFSHGFGTEANQSTEANIPISGLDNTLPTRAAALGTLSAPALGAPKANPSEARGTQNSYYAQAPEKDLLPQNSTVSLFHSKNLKSSLFVYQTREAKKNLNQRYQEKILALAQRYNNQSIEAITNFFGDVVSLITLFYLLYVLEIQINITKSFLLEVFFGLDDSKKSLLILLITDLLVGYHSSNLWELFFEFIFNHYGFPESQTGIFLLVATLPVLLDVLFKYLIFRHLNRSSPATVATYHAMIE